MTWVLLLQRGRGHCVPKWMAVPVRALLDITSRLSHEVKAREAFHSFPLETWNLQGYCLYAMQFFAHCMWCILMRLAMSWAFWAVHTVWVGTAF